MKGTRTGVFVFHALGDTDSVVPFHLFRAQHDITADVIQKLDSTILGEARRANDSRHGNLGLLRKSLFRSLLSTQLAQPILYDPLELGC